MQKGISFLLILFIVADGYAQNGRNWDQHMKLKACNIQIRADYFRAKTFVEMEFYNPRNTESEGLYNFSLLPGQVITAFQLDLNGKYRDGSIEEKWKATNAYNTIVGKRIDPALLKMETPNNYSLRIYPVPARGSRKVTFTIEQLLNTKDGFSTYTLPLMNNDTASKFKLHIDVEHSATKPISDIGFIIGLPFLHSGQNHFLEWSVESLVFNNSIQFKIPLPSNSPIVCTQAKDDQLYWGIKIGGIREKQYDVDPEIIYVYWDISASGAKRNIRREIRFLEQYINYYDIEEVTIVTFNHQIQDSAVFYPLRGYDDDWQKYLRRLEYDGATRLSCLNLNVDADQILLFSDGHNSFGKAFPDKGNVPIHAVFDALAADKNILDGLIEGSGGHLIDLNQLDPVKAVRIAGKIDCFLMGMTATKGKLISHQYFPINVEAMGLLSGSTSASKDTLLFHFGNNSGVRRIEKIPVSKNQECETSGLDKIPMLCVFQSKITQVDWANTFEFGMVEKVVTPYTAYIVLERVEDYIKYNITPPAELEEKCKELNFVKKDYRKQLQEQRVWNQWNAVIGEFNQFIGWYGNTSLIDLNFGTELKNSFSTSTSDSYIPSPGFISGGFDLDRNSRSMALDEVVVVGYGSSAKRDLAASSATVRTNDLYSGVSLENQLAGRVAGVYVTPNSTVPGQFNGIRIRGQTSLRGSNEPLYVFDGVVVESTNILQWINPNDIQSIEILKDAAATAIYGSRAANGVILITTKKGRRTMLRYYQKKYRLKDAEDVEYIEEMKNTPKGLKKEKYEELRIEYGHFSAFYFDMADHFFSIGNSKKAISILLNAAELNSGNISMLRSIAFFFEKWRMWDQAIALHKDLASITGAIQSYRDLGWVYYQSGNFQEAIKTLYAAILLETRDAETKSALLNEINAIIAAHKDNVDISFIPKALIKPLPVDLRILIDGNRQSFYVEIKEPNGAKRNPYGNVSSGNWKFRNYFSAAGSVFEYQAKKAESGTYRISINYRDYNSSTLAAPAFFRIIRFSNFGRPGQKISVEMVNLDNQQGEIEVATVGWPENTKK